ncbi:MAG: ribosomal protein S18-alanine N-acetyltransferase, partial [Oscillospiraceae bacterium]
KRNLMLTVNNMTLEDINDISKLSKQTEFLSVEGLQAELTNKYSITLVAKENDEIVGFINGQLIFDEGCINNIVALSKRKGIGTALLNGFIQYVNQNGGSFINLEVRKSNENAIGLYQKNGFRQIGTRKNFYSNPTEDALLYRWE